ncbi:MAG TPA: hypothetical protein VH107_17280, partial [Lacipirellulaceae bacterium]|nr:hypothetical protein [Lacipirellulaceae bacterium]
MKSHHVCQFLSIAIIALSAGRPASAIVISAASSGYGLDAHNSALGLNVDAGPLPTGASGTSPAPYNLSQTTLNVNTSGSIPAVVSGSISANSVTATAFSNVDGFTGNRTTSATGGCVGCNIGMNTIPVAGGGVTLLGLNGTLSSSAQVTGDYTTLTAS